MDRKREGNITGMLPAYAFAILSNLSKLLGRPPKQKLYAYCQNAVKYDGSPSFCPFQSSAQVSKLCICFHGTKLPAQGFN